MFRRNKISDSHVLRDAPRATQLYFGDTLSANTLVSLGGKVHAKGERDRGRIPKPSSIRRRLISRASYNKNRLVILLKSRSAP